MNWQMKQCVINNSNFFSVKLEFDIKLIFPMQCLFLDDSNLFIAYDSKQNSMKHSNVVVVIMVSCQGSRALTHTECCYLETQTIAELASANCTFFTVIYGPSSNYVRTPVRTGRKKNHV
jgi:hypothetical protein